MNMTGQDLYLVAPYIGAGLAMIAGIGPGVGQVSLQDMNCGGCEYNPGAERDITSTMLLGQAVPKTKAGLYGLVVAMILMFVKPFGA